MNVARGSCSKCERALVYLRWVKGKLKIVCHCQSCNELMTYDLVDMVQALGDDEFDLEGFNPKVSH